MQKLRVRHWALISHGAEAGKSTFIAANARAPIFVVDTDSRFSAVEALVQGEVIYPTQTRNSRALAEEIMETFDKGDGRGFRTLAWDSLTKLYSIHARLAYMRNREGLQKNKAAGMIDKSNAMTIARDLAILGTDCYFVWHTTSGVDGMGQTEVRDMISSVERERLMTSVNVTLEFEHSRGQYGVKVVTARDFAGRKANTGFTLWDEPGNYWAGAADRLERLIYTSFVNPDEAIDWAVYQYKDKLSTEVMPDEMMGEYEHLKEKVQPQSASEMWVAWVQHIDSKVAPAAKTDQEKVVEAAPPQAATAGERYRKTGQSVDDQIEEAKVQAKVAEAAVEQAEPVAGPDGEDYAEQHYETVSEPGLPMGEVLIQGLRDGFGTIENLTLGHVITAAIQVNEVLTDDPNVPLAQLREYPAGFPDAFNAANMEQRITAAGAEKVFNWLISLDALLVEADSVGV